MNDLYDGARDLLTADTLVRIVIYEDEESDQSLSFDGERIPLYANRAAMEALDTLGDFSAEIERRDR